MNFICSTSRTENASDSIYYHEIFNIWNAVTKILCVSVPSLYLVVENKAAYWPMGLLPDTENCRLRMRRECRERFPPPPISKETAS